MKRADSRTAASAVKAMLDAAKGDLQPPEHVKLRRRDLPFWAGIVRARAWPHTYTAYSPIKMGA
jgi:hypothetical protein